MSLVVLDESIWIDAVCVAAARGHDGEVAYIKRLYTGAGGRLARSNPPRGGRDAAADWLASQGVAVDDSGELATEVADEEEYIEDEEEIPVPGKRKRQSDGRVAGKLNLSDITRMRNTRTVDALEAEQDVDDYVDDAPEDAADEDDPQWWSKDAKRWTDDAVVLRSIREANEGQSGRAFRELRRRYSEYIRAIAAKNINDPSLAEEAAGTAVAKLWDKLPLFDGRSKFTTWLYRLTANTAKDALRAAAPQEYNIQRVVKDYRRQVKEATGETISEEEALRALFESGRLKPPVKVVSSSRTSDEGDDYEGSTDEEYDPEVALQRKQEQAENNAKLAKQRKAWEKAKKILTPMQQEILFLRHPGLAAQEGVAPDAPGYSYKEIAEQLNIPIGTVMRRLYDARQAWEMDVPGAVIIPRTRRGAGGVRKNPLRGRDLLAYCETAQDARDLGEAGILSKSEVRSIIRLLRGQR